MLEWKLLEFIDIVLNCDLLLLVFQVSMREIIIPKIMVFNLNPKTMTDPLCNGGRFKICPTMRGWPLGWPTSQLAYSLRVYCLKSLFRFFSRQNTMDISEIIKINRFLILILLIKAVIYLS